MMLVNGHDLLPQEGTATCKQHSTDDVRPDLAVDCLLKGTGNDEEHARLLSVCTNEL